EATPAPRVGRPRRRSAVAMCTVIGAALLLASGCAPAAAPQPESGDATAAASPRAEAPRYRRSGAQGAGEAGGRIARVGAAVALSGPAAMAGAAQRNAIKLAQDEINANRILDQVRLEVIVEDDGSDRERAAA